MRTAGAGMFDFDMHIDNLEVGSGPEYAFARGFYGAEVTPKSGGEPSVIDGKYMTILRKQDDGSWKLYRDCYNSNVPAETAAEPDVEAVTAEIEAIFAEYAASIVAGDADRWIQLWAEDGVQLPPDAPPNVGRDVIYEGISGDFEALDYPAMAIDVEEVLTAGDLAIARGMYTLEAVPKAGGDRIFADGKYTTTFQRQADGSWKIYRDIFNSNVPPPAAAEPDMDAVAAEVQAFWDEYSAANVAGDSDRWIALWQDDGVKMAPGSAPVEGIEAIYAGKQAANEARTTDEMTVTNLEVEVAGDMAFVRGVFSATSTPKEGGDSASVAGNYMSILKRQPDGSWKLYRDIWAPGQP